MDNILIEVKLESLRRCVRRIRKRCPESAAELHGNADLQDIVAVNLIRAVQLCVDIAAHVVSESEQPVPTTMGETFEAMARIGRLAPELALAMKAAVGFRNIAVHAYREIDWDVVFHICHDTLKDFRDFADAVHPDNDG